MPETEVYRNPGYSPQTRLLLIELFYGMDFYEAIKKIDDRFWFSDRQIHAIPGKY
ncbi:MAG TPA: hypothetical protein HA289_01735 [Ferroplasma sp.]|nr:hypothetical protein [Ferroplasma sp.]